MALGVFFFSENARSRFSLILSILNWVALLASVVLVCIGAYIKVKVSEYTNLVTSYHGNSLPYLLIAVGCLTLIINCTGGCVLFKMSNPMKRNRYRPFLLAYIIASVVISISILAAGITSFVYIKHLAESFHVIVVVVIVVVDSTILGAKLDGIINAMKKYGEMLHMKVELDQLQMVYSCCGNEGYADWFKIPWSNSVSDAVPFSCCNPHAQRPCIHSAVHDNSQHLNYDYTSRVTLHTAGCRDNLMDFFGNLLVCSGFVILTIFVVQVCLTVGARYLQTAIDTAHKNPDPLAPSAGYLFMYTPEDGYVDVEAEVRMALLSDDGDSPLGGEGILSNQESDNDISEQSTERSWSETEVIYDNANSPSSHSSDSHRDSEQDGEQGHNSPDPPMPQVSPKHSPETQGSYNASETVAVIETRSQDGGASSRQSSHPSKAGKQVCTSQDPQTLQVLPPKHSQKIQGPCKGSVTKAARKLIPKNVRTRSRHSSYLNRESKTGCNNHRPPMPRLLLPQRLPKTQGPRTGSAIKVIHNIYEAESSSHHNNHPSRASKGVCMSQAPPKPQVSKPQRSPKTKGPHKQSVTEAVTKAVDPKYALPSRHHSHPNRASKPDRNSKSLPIPKVTSPQYSAVTKRSPKRTRPLSK